MSIKVVITRRVPADRVDHLKPLLVQMRSLAMTQPGYISGETLVNLDDSEEYLVISSWVALDNWSRWLSDPRRSALQEEIDKVLGHTTQYQVYCYG
jgi:antibiotic biosynthesis monooxygenase (ABM) superfamily enzyme